MTNDDKPLSDASPFDLGGRPLRRQGDIVTASPDLGYGENRRNVVVASYPDAGPITAWLLFIAADESLAPAGIDHDFMIPIDKTIIVTRPRRGISPAGVLII